MRRIVCDRCGHTMDDKSVWDGLEVQGLVRFAPSTAKHAGMLGRYVVSISWTRFERVGGEVSQVDLCPECIRMVVADLIG